MKVLLGKLLEPHRTQNKCKKACQMPPDSRLRIDVINSESINVTQFSLGQVREGQ